MASSTEANVIFVDTSAWYAIAVADDVSHAPAMDFFKVISSGEFGKMITTDCVLAETYTLLRIKRGTELVSHFAESVARSTNVKTLWIGESDFSLSLEKLLKFNDKMLSFVDCSSSVAMDALGITDVFAFDSDFKTLGYRLHPELRE